MLDIMTKILVPGWAPPGKRPSPAAGKLASAISLLLLGLTTFMGTAVLEFGVPFPPPQGLHPPVPSVSSVLTLPPGGGMEVELMAKGAQMPGILPGPSPPLLGRQNPDLVPNSRVLGPRGINLASLMVLCPFARFSFSWPPLSL